MPLLTILTNLLLLFPFSLADSIYSRSSPVLQVDARSYTRLIERSNYTSILEFYAPWCGHCKNLKPAYEKAASSLSGYAKVAAINCDDDANKAFCGGMGVQGFPTLKIVKPKKKGGKPIVEDYQGPRTAKGIAEAVRDKIPNHVRKITDKDIDAFMAKTGLPKAVFFTEKASVSPLVKSIAIDFLGSMDVAQIRSSETKATGLFMVEDFPKAYFMMSPEHVPMLYDAEMKKEELVTFFEEAGAVSRNPEWASEAPKGQKEKKPKAKAAKKKDMPQGHPEGTSGEACPMAGASKETIAEDMNPTAAKSPNPNVATDQPAPVQVPIETAPAIPELDSETALQKSCLNTKSGTCVLALVASDADPEKSGISSLRELVHKHKQRRAKLFPFYAIPESDEAGRALIKSLGLSDPSAHVTIVALNAKRGWWTRYTGDEIGLSALETWVDNIRFGDFSKQDLPDGIVKEAEERAEKEEPVTFDIPSDLPEDLKVEVLEDHDEL